MKVCMLFTFNYKVSKYYGGASYLRKATLYEQLLLKQANFLVDAHVSLHELNSLVEN